MRWSLGTRWETAMTDMVERALESSTTSSYVRDNSPQYTQNADSTGDKDKSSLHHLS